MEREAVCPVCGKTFTARRKTQVYCSDKCRRYANRHGQRRTAESGTGPTLRTFHCARCGALVTVRDEADKRKKFCSARCSRLYWKHKGKSRTEPAYTFTCRMCGTVVEVQDAADRRTDFCSVACRKKWLMEKRRREKKDQHHNA